MDRLDLPSEKIEFKFLWILEDAGDRPRLEEIPPKSVFLRSIDKVVHPAFTRIVATVQEMNNDIGRKLQGARDRGSLLVR